MQPFTRHTGIAVPLLIKDDINTDQIAPVQAMRAAQAGLQDALLFMRARQRDDGSEDPDFVLNKPQFRKPGILVTGHNFGAGSSREAAVWGMLANNIRVIVAQELCRHLSRELPAERLAADRARQPDERTPSIARVVRGERRGAVHGRSGDASASAGPAAPISPSTFPPADRMRLLEGLDDIGLTLKQTDEIVHWEQRIAADAAVAADGARTADPDLGSTS